MGMALVGAAIAGIVVAAIFKVLGGSWTVISD